MMKFDSDTCRAATLGAEPYKFSELKGPNLYSH